MNFLTDDAIAHAIREALRGAKSAKLAVAYWGKGATKLIGLDNFTERAAILCDPFSGCCDPDVLRDLIKKHRVKFALGMHAKVYWTPRGAIIGSANASMNGLRSSTSKLRYEAGIQIGDEKTPIEISGWFDGVFSNAKTLNESVIKRIEPIWERSQNQKIIPAGRSKNLINLLLNTPEYIENKRIFIMVLKYGEPSQGAKDTYEKIKHKMFEKRIVAKFETNSIYPFYEDVDGGDWDVRPDDVFVDMGWNPDGSVDFNGLWQVRKNSWRHKIPSGGSLVLTDEIESVEGYSLSKSDKIRLSRILEGLIKSNLGKFHSDEFLELKFSEVRKHL